MPSRNSINKPKDTMRQAHNRASLARKRATRARNGLTAPPRSAASSTSGLPKSTAIAIYNGAKPTGALTTTSLSKKRLQKIERNKKYIARRNGVDSQLLIDAAAQVEGSMDVDDEESTTPKQSSKISTVKEAIWSVIEDAASGSFVVDSTGEGTTLGGPSF